MMSPAGPMSAGADETAQREAVSVLDSFLLVLEHFGTCMSNVIWPL